MDMGGIGDILLPPGFGFHPTDVELISHYLKRKNQGLKIDLEVIPEVDIYKFEPWDLPAKCLIPTQDSKWHFFASPGRKYPNGSRSNRATAAGYWKSTGKDRIIKLHNRVIGTKKSLVFHEGRPPCGKRTDWIMHEYCMDPNDCNSPGMKDIFVLCRVTKRDGLDFDGEHAPVKNEEIGTCPKLQNDVLVPVTQEELSSPPQDNEFVEDWIKELLVSDGELKTEPKEDCSSVAFKQEQTDYIPDIYEDLHLAHSGDDIYSNLQSDICDPSSCVPESFYSRNTDLASSTQYEGWSIDDLPLFSFKSVVDDISDHDIDSSLDAGIQLRRRHTVPTDSSTTRFRLKVNKMESKNRQEVNQTIMFENHDINLDSNRNQSRATAVKESKASEDRQTDPSSRTACKANTTMMAHATNLKGRCRAGLINFFMVACMVGIAAVVLHILLPNVRRPVGSFSSLKS